MPSIEINGQKHTVTKDGFGLTLVDGKTIEDFVKDCSVDDLRALVKHGIQIIESNPEHAQDIIERFEI